MRRRYVVKVCPSCLEQADPEGPPYCPTCAENPEPVAITLPASAGRIRSQIYKEQVRKARARIARHREKA